MPNIVYSDLQLWARNWNTTVAGIMPIFVDWYGCNQT